MRIYIRHSDKNCSSSNSLIMKHDPGITDESKITCKQVAQELISKYGLPSFIICSPYRRCRQTAFEMNTCLVQPVEIKCDVRISEYLGHHRYQSLDITPETASYDPPHPEYFHDMDCRVRLHNDDGMNLDSDDQIIWFITHGLIMNRIANAMGYACCQKVPFNGYMVISEINSSIKIELSFTLH